MRKAVCFLLCVIIAFCFAITASAHPGRTDSDGGHTDHSTGDYHYHHGYSAHEHYDMDGDGDVDCPYDFDDKTDHHSGSSGNHSGDSYSHVGNIDEYEVPTNSESAPTAPPLQADIEFKDPQDTNDSPKISSTVFWNIVIVLLMILYFAAILHAKGCSIPFIIFAIVLIVSFVRFMFLHF